MYNSTDDRDILSKSIQFSPQAIFNIENKTFDINDSIIPPPGFNYGSIIKR